MVTTTPPQVQAPLLEPLSRSSSARDRGRHDARRELLQKYEARLAENPALSRHVVSFQANKRRPFYRWLPYKEAFSSALVRYCLDACEHTPTRSVLDPFAGVGTVLTTACSLGWNATGIELMPVGIQATWARQIALEADPGTVRAAADYVLSSMHSSGATLPFPHLRITQRAFPPETERAISRYLSAVESLPDGQLRFLLRFACLAILEEVSFTRKDGQYLRWDARSGRELRSFFNKGRIRPFGEAVERKLAEIVEDISHFRGHGRRGALTVIEDSCLHQLPRLEPSSVGVVLTSPPYCNRYDYTRTYALELAFLGYTEEGVRRLRQELLSATVENKSKRESLAAFYSALGRSQFFSEVAARSEGQAALQEVLYTLRQARTAGQLNNGNIPNLVENYFFEMNLVIAEIARVLAPGGRVFMVNDNVRYHGEEVPVDLILSDLAEGAGLDVEAIWVLPRGKGNSSQQMGTFGRTELRKCVYVWRKSLS
jgi:hypothetical protein